MKKICAIIPCYNVSQTLKHLIIGVGQFFDTKDIVIVDDGSTDDTANIAVTEGVVVLSNSTNHGKGAALKKGFDYAIHNNYQAVLCLDGDLQHSPADIPNFLKTFEEKDVALILGSRISDLISMPWDRQFSNQTTSLIISLLTGQRVRDSQSGYRLIKTDVLKKITLTSSKYETESELLVKALRYKFKFAHVPIKTIYNNQPSHIHRLIDTLRFVRIVTKSLMKKN